MGKRKDCAKCKFKNWCEDIFEEEGICPADRGGETWAKYSPKEKRKGK